MSADLRDLALARLDEAQVLLGEGRPSGAYYLAGYTVECGLKAIIVKEWQTLVAGYSLPEKADLLQTYVHSFTKLLNVCGLAGALEADSKRNARFRAFWEIANNWSESSRYQIWTPQAATDMVLAVSDPKDGVLPWLQTHW